MADETQQAKSIRKTITATRERLQRSKRLIRRVEEALEHAPGHSSDNGEKI